MRRRDGERWIRSEERFLDPVPGAFLDVQLNSTACAAVRDDVVAYDLEVRAYDILRQENANRPRILVVLVLPEDENEWLSQTEDVLMPRRCAYWMSLRGAGPPTAQTTVRNTIPRADVFSVRSLQAPMHRARGGESP